MYDNYTNNQKPGSFEYPCSCHTEGSANAPMELKPRKRKVGKIIAAILCAVLLLGGGFGAGWFFNSHRGTIKTQLVISDRLVAEVETVNVTGNEKLSFSQVYDANVNSCVSINTSGTATVGYNIFGQQIQSQVASAGSGFILTADGYIATNCHVIADASSVQITLNDGTTYDAQIIGSDADYDIAILKVDPGETKLKPVTLGTSSSLKVGEDVSTIGNPLGQLTFSMTRGIVSCVNREINLNGTPFNMIQIDTAINHGNSGGPLFNSYGEVVGIVTAKTSQTNNGDVAEGLGFAIPIDDVLTMLKDIMENGQVTTHAYMGVTPDNASRYPQSGVRSGAYLIEVAENSPASKAGLQKGDVITMLGTTTITSSSDLHSVVGSKSYKAGDTASVTYVRDGKVCNTEITFGSTLEKPADSEVSTKAPSDQKADENGNPYGDMEEFFERFFG